MKPKSSSQSVASSDESAQFSPVFLQSNHVLPKYDPAFPYYSFFGFESASPVSTYSTTAGTTGTAVLQQQTQPESSSWTRFMASIKRRYNQVKSQASIIPSQSTSPLDSISTQQQQPSSTAQQLLQKQDLKVVVVGVHGWYPAAAIVQTVFGELEGTSEKFGEMMRQALLKHLSPHHSQLSIDEVLLSGHGRVNSRVDRYLSLLNSSPSDLLKLRLADMVVFVTHSQGMPVSMSVASQLLRDGTIDSQRQVVGMLCMAGIGHGPYPVLKGNLVIQYVEADAARELFEFCEGGSEKLKSQCTIRLWHDLKYLLECNVFITLIGSWRDQAVPIYSALMSAFNHPNLLRAVYIDSRFYLDDFLNRLIVFLIRLKNMGISDHGLLCHLSTSLSGSLYNDSAHSTIYDDIQVYSLAVKWLLHNADRRLKVPAQLVQYTLFDINALKNPYFIPWSMAKLQNDIENKYNSPELKRDFAQLIQDFRKWKVGGKSSKILRYRLEPLGVRHALLRSKL